MPASYPTAVKTFTTKNTGDAIQAAHINDLQDEVSAIEGGLLGGTAPLHSSNSTLANLSVLGGSTLASLQVSGDSTITGTLTVQTIVSTSVSPSAVTSAVRVTSSGVTQFANASTQTRLAMDVKEYDLSSEWDSTLFTFTPKSSGYYSITGRYMCPTGAIGTIYCSLWFNDSVVCQGTAMAGAGQVNATPSIAWTGHLSSGVPVTVRAYAGSTARTSSGIYASAEFIKLY
jgi:hypothetical protein